MNPTSAPNEEARIRLRAAATLLCHAADGDLDLALAVESARILADKAVTFEISDEPGT